jgi:hypothetical protein
MLIAMMLAATSGQDFQRGLVADVEWGQCLCRYVQTGWVGRDTAGDLADAARYHCQWEEGQALALTDGRMDMDKPWLAERPRLISLTIDHRATPK